MYLCAGGALVSQLVASPLWDKVITIGRRPVELAAPSDKLTQVTINMDHLESDPQVAAALSSGIDSVFCALGTTRAAAGSASRFKQVDFEYVAAAARAAKAAGIPHFSLISAQGANPRVWASDLRPFHGLLYTRTKGDAEEAVKAQNFAYTTIMRPGLLDRGDKARSLEKFVARLMSSVPIEKVASVMKADAEMCHAGGVEHREGLRVWSMNDIKSYGQEM